MSDVADYVPSEAPSYTPVDRPFFLLAATDVVYGDEVRRWTTVDRMDRPIRFQSVDEAEDWLSRQSKLTARNPRFMLVRFVAGFAIETKTELKRTP